MRQIDNMTAGEIDTLALKGMTPDRRTIPAEKPTAAQKLNDLATELHIQRDEARAHADKLAEALRYVANFSYTDYASNYGEQSALQEFVAIKRKARRTLAAYEAAQ